MSNKFLLAATTPRAGRAGNTSDRPPASLGLRGRIALGEKIVRRP